MHIVTPDLKPPEFLLPKPDPRPVPRMFNRQLYQGWEGLVRLEDLHGWLGNPRLDVPIQQFKEEYAREPTDDELLDLLLTYSEATEGDGQEDDDDTEGSQSSRRNKLLLLAESIRINGMRVPVILSSERRLLDGNRRFFAAFWLQKTAPPNERDNYADLPAWVLPEATGPDDEDRVITEMNFIDDGKMKWPYSVQARRVYRDHVEKGMSFDELADKYHTWTKSRIKAVIEAARVAEDFVAHHDESADAQDLAYRHLIWFDQLQRSNRKALEKEGFRTAVFDMIMEEGPDGQGRLRRTKDFVRLGEIYGEPAAWDALVDTPGKQAVEKAEFVLDRKRFEDRSDADERMQRINQLLKSLSSEGLFSRVEKPTMDEFQRLSLQVPGAPVDPESRVSRMIEWLADLTSREMAEMPSNLRLNLAEGLDRVIKQSSAYGSGD